MTEPDAPSSGEPEMPTLHGPKRRTRAEIGKANIQNSKTQERIVVSYLRVSGWPHAERTVRTGYKTRTRTSSDRGDIDGTLGIVWQIKNYAEKEWWRVGKWLAETEQQRAASNANVGILVLRRHGHAHPSEWWAYLYLHDLVGLVVAAHGAPTDIAPPGVPVRLELQHVLPILRDAGFGKPNVADEVAS